MTNKKSFSDRFDEEFPQFREFEEGFNEIEPNRKKIKQFFLSELKDIIKEIEGEKKTECFCHQGGGYNVCCEECKNTLACRYNLATNRAIQIIKNRLEI
jgi:hypothetical protein